MKVTLESTTQIVDINNGVKARLWEGKTESGVEVHAFITRIAIDKDASPVAVAEFERELLEQKPPRADLAGFLPRSRDVRHTSADEQLEASTRRARRIAWVLAVQQAERDRELAAINCALKSGTAAKVLG